MKMKNIYKIALSLLTIVASVSCQKSSDDVQLRGRQVVYDENISEIESYLKNNYLVINGDEVEVKAIDAAQTSIWDEYKDVNFGNEVPYKMVKNDLRNTIFTDGLYNDPVDYKMYYIVINEGGGQSPITIDSTYTAYKGWNFDNEVFDENTSGRWFTFPETSNASISGFRQILPEIKTAESSSLDSSSGLVTYTNYGNVVVFIPSGLAYFNKNISIIGAYSPIAFQIKLFALKERDHDFDHILTKYEDLNGNGDFFDDDTDGDKAPNFMDVDDDGDGFLTRREIKKPSTENSGESLYYPYNPILVDDPSTPENEIETKGIPRKFTGPVVNGYPTPVDEDYTDPTRLRRHLDPTSKPPYGDE